MKVAYLKIVGIILGLFVFKIAIADPFRAPEAKRSIATSEVKVHESY